MGYTKPSEDNYVTIWEVDQFKKVDIKYTQWSLMSMVSWFKEHKKYFICIKRYCNFAKQGHERNHDGFTEKKPGKYNILDIIKAAFTLKLLNAVINGRDTPVYRTVDRFQHDAQSEERRRRSKN